MQAEFFAALYGMAATSRDVQHVAGVQQVSANRLWFTIEKPWVHGIYDRPPRCIIKRKFSVAIERNPFFVTGTLDDDEIAIVKMRHHALYARRT
jgi:hypothetical protein